MWVKLAFYFCITKFSDGEIHTKTVVGLSFDCHAQKSRKRVSHTHTYTLYICVWYGNRFRQVYGSVSTVTYLAGTVSRVFIRSSQKGAMVGM